MSTVVNNLLHGIAKLGVLFAIVISFALSADAQLTRGGISGTVFDATKAAIDGAQVKITNLATGEVHNTTTNDTGFYQVPLDSGLYTAEFSKSGFQTGKAPDIEVTSSKDTVVNFPLTLPNVTTNVDVRVTGMELDKTTATIRLTLPGRLLDEIPMSSSSLVPAGSRNATRYALWAPGIARVLFQNETSANGHRGRENNYMVDGTDNNDQSITLPALFVPPEAIQEVDVQAATFSAVYGRNIGGQINVITKRGSNTFRGELWEFYRGNALEPFAFSDRKAGLTSSPRLVDNQFGGSIGGPIIKNKTFFFGILQANLLRTGPRASATATIPTPAGYAALLSSAPGPGQSAASRQAMLDALSFLPDIHSTVQSYSNVTSTSQIVNTTPIEVGTFNAVLPTHQNIWYSTIRVDHELTPNDRLTYRSHMDRRNSPLNTGNLAFGELWAVDNKYFAQNHFLGYTRTIGSRFYTEARLTYSRLFPSFEERDKVTPTVTLTSLFSIGSPSAFPQERLEQTWQFQNVSHYSLSRHSLKFGLDLAKTRLDSNTGTHLRGTWTFTNLQAYMNNQATSLSYLAGAPQKFTFHQLRQAYFLQDDFKLTRNLTTNLGLRYETSNIPLGFFGATTADALGAGVPGPVERDKNNWGPRLGFVYTPQFSSGLLGTIFGEEKSAIRGGFGVSYDVLFYSLAANASGNYPRNDLLTYTSTALVDQFPVLPPRNASPTFNATNEFINIPSNAQNPTSNYWSLSIQRQVHDNYTFEIGYSGNRSYHLIRQSQNNPTVLSAAQAATVIATCTPSNLGTCQNPTPPRVNTAWGSRRSLETTGQASYNSAYIQVNGRTSFGLRFGANYTWSANLSDSEEFSNDSTNASDGGLAGSSPQVPQNFFDRRNEWARSVFDRPHRVTFNYTYAIPWFRSSSPLLQQIFGGWQWSGFTELQSGQPFTIKIGVDAVGNGITGVGSARPDYNAGGVLIEDPATGNLRTFFIPKDGTGIVTAPQVTDSAGAVTFLRNSMPIGGTLGRNTFRGPGYANFNMSLAKRFTIPGERQLQIRGDFINVFNHDNFPNPDSNMSSPTFGKQVTPRLLTDARQVLLGVKLAF